MRPLSPKGEVLQIILQHWIGLNCQSSRSASGRGISWRTLLDLEKNIAIRKDTVIRASKGLTHFLIHFVHLNKPLWNLVIFRTTLSNGKVERARSFRLSFNILKRIHYNNDITWGDIATKNNINQILLQLTPIFVNGLK
jgi:hypothetical protein